ncbi:hypothetical protein Plhal710r2_c054g0161851 [Plasmopara halstedii]
MSTDLPQGPSKISKSKIEKHTSSAKNSKKSPEKQFTKRFSLGRNLIKQAKQFLKIKADPSSSSSEIPVKAVKNVHTQSPKDSLEPQAETKTPQFPLHLPPLKEPLHQKEITNQEQLKFPQTSSQSLKSGEGSKHLFSPTHHSSSSIEEVKETTHKVNGDVVSTDSLPQAPPQNSNSKIELPHSAEDSKKNVGKQKRESWIPKPIKIFKKSAKQHSNVKGDPSSMSQHKTKYSVLSKQSKTNEAGLVKQQKVVEATDELNKSGSKTSKKLSLWSERLPLSPKQTPNLESHLSSTSESKTVDHVDDGNLPVLTMSSVEPQGNPGTNEKLPQQLSSTIPANSGVVMKSYHTWKKRIKKKKSDDIIEW